MTADRVCDYLEDLRWSVMLQEHLRLSSAQDELMIVLYLSLGETCNVMGCWQLGKKRVAFASIRFYNQGEAQ